MKEQIEALQNTYTHLLDAHTTYRKFMSLTKRPDVGGVLNQIAGIAQIVTAQCQVICAERDRQNDRIYGKGILRVRINGGDHSHEITVQRPDNTCDNPHINEVAYNALKFKLGTAELSSTADFDIDVMSSGCRKVTTIRRRV